jgi:hypothetical protein
MEFAVVLKFSITGSDAETSLREYDDDAQLPVLQEETYPYIFC